MKLPFLKHLARKNFAAMTEEELERDIERCEATLGKRPALARAAALGSIITTAAAQMTFLVMAGWVITGAVAFGGLAVGAGFFFGIGYAGKAVMTRAIRQRNGMVDVFNAKLTARMAAEQEEMRLRNLEAAEKFNAAVDAGLPLERDITVKRALKLKFPEPPARQGFARIIDIFDPRP
jgi:hypothetical protein